jgi:hypothetical protein
MILCSFYTFLGQHLTLCFLTALVSLRLVSLSPYLFFPMQLNILLKMEASVPLTTFVTVYHTAWFHIPYGACLAYYTTSHIRRPYPHIYCLENTDFSKLYLTSCVVVVTGLEFLQCLDGI